jgi:hypothetical protein
MASAGSTPEEIATELQRQLAGITARLEKLGLAEPAPARA